MKYTKVLPMADVLFLKHPAPAVLKARIALHSNLLKLQNECTATFYFEASDCFQETYSMGDAIAETDTNAMCITQPSNKPPEKQAEVPSNKALWFYSVLDEYVEKRKELNFIRILLEPTHHSILSFWGSNKNAPVHFWCGTRLYSQTYNLAHKIPVPADVAKRRKCDV